MGPDGAFDDLVAFLAARDDAEGSVVSPALRSVVRRGERGAGAFVLLHGLTASPPGWRDVAAALAAQGCTVVIPRLPLHGHADRMTRALREIRPHTLTDFVGEVLARVAALGEPITIVGISLGGALAIDAALRTPVARVVAIAPFLGIAFVPHEVHPLLIQRMLVVPDVYLWWNPVLRERLEPLHVYPRYPLRAIATGLAIADAARTARRPPQTCALDIVLNEGEASVNNRTARHLAADWRAAGASVAVHRLRGLGRSHDIIEPTLRPAQAALPTLLAIIAGEHVATDREHVVAARR